MRNASSSPFKRTKKKSTENKIPNLVNKSCPMPQPALSLGKTEAEHHAKMASLTPNSRRILSHLKLVPVNVSLQNDNLVPLSFEIKKSRSDGRLKVSSSRDTSMECQPGNTDYRVGTRLKRSFKASPVSYKSHSETLQSTSKESDFKSKFPLSYTKTSKHSPHNPYVIDPIFTTSIDSIHAHRTVFDKPQSKIFKKSLVSFDSEQSSATIENFNCNPLISIPDISTDLSIRKIEEMSFKTYQKSRHESITQEQNTQSAYLPDCSNDHTIERNTENSNFHWSIPSLKPIPSPLALNLKLSKYFNTNSSLNLNNDLSIESITDARNVSITFTPIPSPLVINKELSKYLRTSAPTSRNTSIGLMTDLSIETIHNKSSPGQQPPLKTTLRQYNRKVAAKPLASRPLTSLKVSTSTPNKSPRAKSVWTVTPTKNVQQNQKPTAIPPRLLGQINRPWIQTPPRKNRPKVEKLQSHQVCWHSLCWIQLMYIIIFLIFNYRCRPDRFTIDPRSVWCDCMR